MGICVYLPVRRPWIGPLAVSLTVYTESNLVLGDRWGLGGQPFLDQTLARRSVSTTVGAAQIWPIWHGGVVGHLGGYTFAGQSI